MDKKLIITTNASMKSHNFYAYVTKRKIHLTLYDGTICGGKLYKIEYMRKRHENKIQGVFFFNNNLSLSLR